MGKIHYNPALKQRARELRNNATFSERYLWKYLRGRQLLGYQFSRQKPIGNYIVDFYCSPVHLVIEVDGITHDGKQEYDEKRENALKRMGLEVLRFDGHYVVNHIEETLKVIASKIEEMEKKASS